MKKYMTAWVRAAGLLGLLIVLTAGLSTRAAAAEAKPPHFILVLNITELEKSVDFYTRIIGMKEVKRMGDPNAPGSTVTVILSYSGRDGDFQIAMLYQKDRKAPLEIGNGLSRIAFIVPDAKPILKGIADAGYEITRPLTEVKQAKLSYAFAKDPNGYIVEVEERYGW